MKNSFTIVAGVIAAAVSILAATPAMAGGVDIGINIGIPGIYAPPVYVEQQSVYVEPQPIYVQPQPVYVERRAVYVESESRHEDRDGGHHGHQHGEHRDDDDDD